MRTMSQLNIFELYKSINEKKLQQTRSFEKVLQKSHSKIKLAAKNNHYECFYEVPEVIVGVPLYNITDCIQYVIQNLKDNGFYIYYIYPKNLYISWNPKLVNNEDIKKKNNNLLEFDSFDNLLTNKNNGKFSLTFDH